MTKFLRFYLIGLLFGTFFAQADTITLKSGEKVDGRVLRDTDTDVTIQVKVSASITDERVIPKSEIDKIDKQTEDDIAFQDLKNLKPDPMTSLSPDGYDRAVVALDGFQNKYPASAHHTEVQTALDAFLVEKKHVEDGQVKFHGAWIGKAQAAKWKTQILGEQLFTAMKEFGGRGDFSNVLNTFDRLEKEAKGAEIFPDAVDYDKQVLASLQAQVQRSLGLLAHSQQDFKNLLDLTSEPKKTELANIAKSEEARNDAALAAAQKAGTKWPPLISRSQKSLAALQQALPPEITRVAALPVQKMRDSNARLERAKAAIETKDWAAADALLKEAAALWPDNEMAKQYADIVNAAKAAASPPPTAAAKQAAAEAAASQAQASNQSPKPFSVEFFKTIPGAMTIVGVVILVIGGLTLLGRVRKPTDESPR